MAKKIVKLKSRSFEWYMLNDSIFLIHLSKAIIYADDNNIEKLSLIFPHIIRAYGSKDWSIEPATNYKITTNDDSNQNIKIFKYDVIYNRAPCNFIYDEKSFIWYLKFCESFYSNLSKTVIYADKNNLKLIQSQYQDLVSAYLHYCKLIKLQD